MACGAAQRQRGAVHTPLLLLLSAGRLLLDDPRPAPTVHGVSAPIPRCNPRSLPSYLAGCVDRCFDLAGQRDHQTCLTGILGCRDINATSPSIRPVATTQTTVEGIVGGLRLGVLIGAVQVGRQQRRRSQHGQCEREPRVYGRPRQSAACATRNRRSGHDNLHRRRG